MALETIDLKAEYKGYTISWEARDKTWVISLDDKAAKRGFASPDKAQEWIEAQLKRHFRHQPILIRYGWGSSLSFESGVATSITEDNAEAWILVKGKRSKETLKVLFLDTPKNQALIAVLKDYTTELSTIHDKVDVALGHMEILKPEMMIEEKADDN